MKFRAMRGYIWIWIWIMNLSVVFGTFDSAAHGATSSEDFLVVAGDTGRRGGRLVAALHSDPKSLNPITAVDASSKEVIGLLFADLIHINPYTQHTEAAIAKTWKSSPDGK